MGSRSNDEILKLIFNNKIRNAKYLNRYMQDCHGLNLNNQISFSYLRNSFEDKCETIHVDNSSHYNFVRCTSYFKTENIALWKIYGNKGYCVQYTSTIKKRLSENIKKIEIVEGDKCIEISNFNNLVKFETAFVVYKDEERKTLLRATHLSKPLEDKKFKNALKKKDFSFKDMGYSFECEIKIFAKIDKDTLNTIIKNNKLDESKNENNQIYLIITYKKPIANKILRSPFANYSEEDKKANFKKSYYFNKVSGGH